MRLFFALWPPLEIAEPLAAIARSVAKQFGGVPMRQETIHLTLAFLGEVEDARLDLLMQTTSAVRANPFTLHLDRLGYWKHNRLLWAGCSSSPEGLLHLASDLRQSLAAQGLYVEDAKKDFIPHVTLIRKTPEVAIQKPPEFDRVCWPCSRFVLVRSLLSSAGPSYEIASEFSFSP